MNKKAFTLIELLVVIVIIAVLAAFAITTYRRSIQDAEYDEALVTLERIGGAFMRMKMEHPSLEFENNGLLNNPPANYTNCAYKCSAGVCPNVYNLITCGYLDNLKPSNYEFYIYGQSKVGIDGISNAESGEDDGFGEESIAYMKAKNDNAAYGGKEYKKGEVAARFFERNGINKLPPTED